jgi:hypothetical protein
MFILAIFDRSNLWNKIGTSMAAPAITGLIVLLQQHYKNTNTVLWRQQP